MLVYQLFELMQSVDFSVIVNMFAMEGMVALGKLKHPATGETECNLDQAKFVIDLLSVLQHKTKGNLDASESNLLEQALSGLRLNYVHESSTGEARAPEPDAGGMA